MLTIITNNKSRELIAFNELTHAERKDFDYLKDEDEFYTPRFFRYKGEVYDTQDSETTHDRQDLFPNWDGFFSETFFSGVVFKFAPDTDYEEVIVGRYYAEKG